MSPNGLATGLFMFTIIIITWLLVIQLYTYTAWEGVLK